MVAVCYGSTGEGVDKPSVQELAPSCTLGTTASRFFLSPNRVMSDDAASAVAAGGGGSTTPAPFRVVNPKSPPLNMSSLGISASVPSPLDTSSTAVGGQTMNIRSLIAQKEKELHDINDYRVGTLEEELRRREKSESVLRAKFAKLKEDFTYNLKLIEDRDAELDRYEGNFESLKGVIRGKDSELHELRTQVADLQGLLSTERSRAKSNDSHYESKMRDMNEALEKEKWGREDSERNHREVLDACKRDLATQLRVKDEQILKQRQEMNISHDEVMRKREEDFRHAEEGLRSQMEELEKNFQAVKVEANNAQTQLVQKCREAERLAVEVADLDRSRKQLTRDLEEERVSQKEQIAGLEKEKRELAQVKQALLDEYEGKMGELLESLHSVERAFIQQREQFDLQLAHVEKEREQEMERSKIRMDGRNDALMARISQAEQETAKFEAQLKSAQMQHEDQTKSMRNDYTERIKELTSSLTTAEEISTDLKNQLFNRDLQLKTKDEEVSSLKNQIDKIQNESRSFRSQMDALTEQNNTMARENMDLNLRWEQRWEEERHREAEKHSELTQVLQQQRDHLGKEKRDLEDRIVELEAELNRTRAELNAVRAHTRLEHSLDPNHQYASQSIAARKPDPPAPSAKTIPPSRQVATSEVVEEPPASPLFSEDMGPPSPLKEYPLGESPDRHALPQGWPAPGIQNPTAESPREIMMQQENNRLRQVIGQMREEMESMKDLADAKADINYPHEERTSNPRKLATARLQKRGFDLSSFGNEDTEEQEENASLRQKLKNASEDLQRLMGEREKLFEVSNNLKSELSRVENESKANSQNIVTAVSEAEKETSRKYEHKVSTIEARLAELAAHNKALTGELSKWSAAGKNSIFSQGVMDDDDDFGPRVSVDIASDNINLDDSVDWSITQSQEFHQFAPDEDESSIADAVRNKMKLYRERNLTEQAAEDKRRLKTRSARERLQRAREGLELAGKRGSSRKTTTTNKKPSDGLSLNGKKAPAVTSGSTRVSRVRDETAGQERAIAHSKEMQSGRARRQRLAAERKRVRNYNDFSKSEDDGNM